METGRNAKCDFECERKDIRIKQTKNSEQSQQASESQASMLEELQRDAFAYFMHECNRETGLAADKTRDGWPASIAATGLALPVYLVGVEHGWMDREEVLSRTLTTLRFFHRSAQEKELGEQDTTVFTTTFLICTQDSELSPANYPP